MRHLTAALAVLGDEQRHDHGTPGKPTAHARWVSGDRWDVKGQEVKYMGKGQFSVDGQTVHDEDLGAALSFRFRWDPGILTAIDQLAAGV